MSKKNFYAVVKGHQPGIYTEWSGINGAEVQVKGFSGAVYKGFSTRAEADTWFKEVSITQTYPPKSNSHARSNSNNSFLMSVNHSDALAQGKTVVYTDGACIGNPGPGGYGIVLLRANSRLELSGGYRLTTNNRMELTACIVALENLKTPGKVMLFSDSQYVVNGINQNWAKNWQARGWCKNNGNKAENSDLWAKLLDLCEQHSVEFIWVRGHAGTKENERCDQLSIQAANERDLPKDIGYIPTT